MLEMGNKSNECPKCGKIYVLSSSLKTHLLSHVKDSIYKCTICHMTFSGEAGLQKHRSNQECDKNTGESPSDLHNIHSSFDTFSKNAKGKSHKAKPLKVYHRHFKCSRCPVTFSDKVKLKDHLATHAADVHISTEPEREVTNHEKLRMVAKVDSPKYIENNTKAQAETKGYSLKSDALRDAHNSVVCPFCRRTFSVEAELSRHIATHTHNGAAETNIPLISKAVTCTESVKEITMSSGENIMQNYNNDEKVNESAINECYPDLDNQRCFSCPKCQMIFSSKIELENHVSSLHYDVRISLKSEEVDIVSINDNAISYQQYTKSNPLKAADPKIGFTTLFKCLNCPMTFLIKTEIEKHVLTHANDDVNDNIPNQFKEVEVSKTSENEISTSSHDSYKLNGKFSKKEIKDSSCTVKPIRAFHKFFKCNNCPMIFLAKTEVENHVLTHIDNDIFYFNVPLKSEDNRSGTVIENPNSPPECVSTSFDNNIRIFKSYECPVCSMFFSGVAEVACHMLLCHKSLDSNILVQLGDVYNSETYEQNIIVDSFQNICIKENSTADEANAVSGSILSPHLQLAYYNFETSEEKLSHKHQKIKTEKNFEERTYNCTVCGKEFDEEKKFLDHRRIHGIRKHSCKECGKSFRANSYLKAHMRVHSDSRPHRCTDCNKTFKSDTALKMHQVVHSDKRPYKCSICDLTFKYKNSLTLHGLVHSVNRPFKCEICEKDFKSALALKGHMKTHTEKNINEKKLYYCTECCKTYSNEKNYQYHMRLHSGDVPHRCEYCGKGFIVKPFLTQHLRIHTGERPYKCPLCEKRFAVRSTLRNHMDTHSDKKRYVCHICGVHISQRQTLSSHLKKHSGIKQHECNLCGKRFFLKSNYGRHMRIHNGERPFQCLLCKKSFKQNAHLKNHMASHTGEKPYQCHICNKCFTYKSSHKNHMITHTVNRPFICAKCGKSFRSRGGLKVHNLTHNTEERFACPDCGKKFKLESSLVLHMKKKSDGTPYKCQICKKTFTRRACFHQHKKSHVIEMEASDVDKHKNLCQTQMRNSEELESIKVTEVMDNFDGHESIQVHIIV